MSGPLSGIKILDFTHARAGPHATMMLGDMGATVIKVERNGGEAIRQWGPSWNDYRVDFMSVNRNKQSLVLDLKDEKDVALALELADEADVVIQNLRPGVMDSFGLGEAQIRPSRERLIYCTINGYGSEGPLATEPCYDNVIQAFSGLMSTTGTDASGPVRSGIPIADLVTGVMAAQGILAALYERQVSGRGQHVQVSLLESVISLLSFHAQGNLLLGIESQLAGNDHPILAPTGLFTASDGQLVIAVSTDPQWHRLAVAIGSEELISDERFASNDDRVRNRVALNELLNQRLATRTRAEWLEVIMKAKVPVGPLQTVGEAMSSPQVLANDMVIEMPTANGPAPTIGFPIKFDRTPCSIRLGPPVLGEHSSQIRERRGFGRVDLT